MMINLKLSGKLACLKGLIVGGFTEMKDNEIPFGKDAYEIIYEHVKDYAYPVCFGFPSGHIDNNQALLFGAKAKLKISNETVELLL